MGSKSTASMTPNIGLFQASCRQTSLNAKLVRSVQGILQAKGADTTVIDLLEYEMPLFCGDDDIPDNAQRLINELKRFDAIFISTPEFNGSIPAMLKNLIDWTSILGTEHFTKPIYAIGSATPGAMSGIMAMQHLSFLLTRLGATVIPIMVGTGHAKTAFDEKGNLVTSPAAELAVAMADQLLTRVMERKAHAPS